MIILISFINLFREQVPVLGMGFTVLFILPAAFVELPTDSVLALAPLKQIKIYCAGVWHNIMLSAVSFTILISLPFLAAPLFSIGSGIYIYGMDKVRKSSLIIFDT